MSTEADVLTLLRKRYSARTGNGPRYAYAQHVKNATGWNVGVADFIAMDMWPSQNCALHGHEVKVSRSDWLAELRDPPKSLRFRCYMDYWWLVVSDATVVRNDLPVGWGLMIVDRSGGLRIATPAPRLDSTKPMPKPFIAALLRASMKTARIVEDTA